MESYLIMSTIIIPIKNLSHGDQRFDFKVDKAFTDSFGDSEIISTNCDICIVAERKRDWVEVTCNIKGIVVVLCDRCLEQLTLPIEVSQLLTVRFDKNPEDIIEDDNVIVMSSDEDDLDLSQSIYDFICLSIPLQRVHPDGECNPEMLSKIGVGEKIISGGNSPFSNLKNILENNNN